MKRLYILYILLIIGILLVIPSVSSFEFDNTKNFNKGNLEYGKIEIINAFGLGSTLAEITLDKNTDVCTYDCSAEGTTTLYIERKLFNGLRFEKLTNGKWIEWNIKDYKIYILEKGSWVLYKNQELNKGTYKWKITGEKEWYESVDWLANLLGVELDDWAIWGATTRYEYFTGEDNDGDEVQSGIGWFQTFTVGEVGINESFYIENLTIKGGYQGSGNTESIWASIFATNSTGGPTGNPLVISYPKSGGDFPASPAYSLSNISFPKTYELQKGTQYGLYLNCSGGGGNGVIYRLNSSNEYSGGEIIRTSGCADGINPGCTEEWRPTKDIIFEIFGATLSNVSLNSPVDNGGSTLSEVEFNCSADVSPSILSNISLWHNNTAWDINETNSTLGGFNSTLINTTFPDGIYVWNCEACADTGVCSFATNNYTLTVDGTPPKIDLDNPSGTYNYSFLLGNLTINWSVTETNPGACWYEYNMTNFTVNCDDNNATLTLGYGKELIFWANDSGGGVSSNTTTWDYNVFKFEDSYNLNTTEGNAETFTANVSILNGRQLSEIDLIYNNTVFPGTIDSRTDQNYSVSTTITIPNIASYTNFTWHWNYTLDNGEKISSLSTNQSATHLSIDDCSTNTYVIVNFTLRDEETTDIINSSTYNSSIEVDVDIFSISNGEQILNYSGEKRNDSGQYHGVCLSTALGNSVYRMDVETRYSGDDYVSEFYHIQNYSLSESNMHQNISLYGLLSADSTEFLITFKNSRFLHVKGALIDITRRYVDEGLFRTIEIPKTDISGQAIGHFDLNGVKYTIIISKEGEILATFDDVAVICQDSIIGDCDINLNAGSTTIPFESWNEVGGLTYTTSFNKTQRKITIIFTSADGAAKTVSVNTTKFDRFGNQTVCADQLTSSSGTLTCEIPIGFGNITTTSKLWSNGKLITTINHNFGDTPFDNFGLGGYVFLILLLLSIPLMFISSPVGVVFGVIIGLILGSLLLIYEGGVGVGAFIIWALIAGGIIIWKINHKGDI